MNLDHLNYLVDITSDPVNQFTDAENKKTMNTDSLYVKTITVDGGPAIKRFRPRAQGRAFGIRKKMAHISVTLGEK